MLLGIPRSLAVYSCLYFFLDYFMSFFILLPLFLPLFVAHSFLSLSYVNIRVLYGAHYGLQLSESNTNLHKQNVVISFILSVARKYANDTITSKIPYKISNSFVSLSHLFRLNYTIKPTHFRGESFTTHRVFLMPSSCWQFA